MLAIGIGRAVGDGEGDADGEALAEADALGDTDADSPGSDGETPATSEGRALTDAAGEPGTRTLARAPPASSANTMPSTEVTIFHCWFVIWTPPVPAGPDDPAGRNRRPVVP